jgi:hypothetical protein
MTLSITTLCKITVYANYYYAECHYAECNGANTPAYYGTQKFWQNGSVEGEKVT